MSFNLNGIKIYRKYSLLQRAAFLYLFFGREKSYMLGKELNKLATLPSYKKLQWQKMLSHYYILVTPYSQPTLHRYWYGDAGMGGYEVIWSSSSSSSVRQESPDQD